MGIFGDIIDVLTTPLPRADDLFPEGSILDVAATAILAHNAPRPPSTRSAPPVVIVDRRVEQATRSQQPINMGTVQPGGPGGFSPGGFQTISNDLFGGGLPFIDIVPESGNLANRFFVPSRMAGARPRSTVMLPNPVTGKPTWFKHAGRPILWTGDLAATRRVARVAARARKSRGRR